MSKYTLIAASSFGLESIVAQELRSLGYDNLVIGNGKVMFEGDERDIARCNVWLRTADRIFIKVAEFKATLKQTPPQLFVGLPDRFGKVGEYKHLLKKYGLNASDIAARIRAALVRAPA